MISRAIVVWVLLVIGTILISVQIGLKVEARWTMICMLCIASMRRSATVSACCAPVIAYLTASDQLQPLAERHLALEPVRGGSNGGVG